MRSVLVPISVGLALVMVFCRVSIAATEVSVDLGTSDTADGLTHPQFTDDGNTTPVTVAGIDCRRNVTPGPGYPKDLFFYFAVDDGWAYAGRRPEVDITIDYYNTGTGAIQLEYDSSDFNEPPYEGAYKSGGSVELTGTDTWKQHTFHVTDANFANRQQVGAVDGDFRIRKDSGYFYLDVVRVLARAPRWQMYEVSLTASGSPPNPFTDTTLTATVTPPTGEPFTINGFYDGDGSGGQSGNVWKLRFSPDELGTWQWTTSSNDAGLNGQSGQFECVSSGEPGPIVANGRYFEWADGGPVYLIGNFLDRVQPTYEEFSHTILSEEISETNRQNMIDRHRDFHKANKMNIYVANDGDYGDVSTTPWVGSDNSNDKTRFDLSRWKMYDRIIAQLKAEGMIAELWFFADDSGFGDLSDADRQRLIKYGMSRLSAYPHTMFVLCLEWQEGWSTSEVSLHMTYLQEHNPWGRLASVHGTTGNFAFPNEWWADFMATQSGNSITPPGNNSHTVYNRGLANKPLIVEEFGLLDSTYDKRLRGNLWACFCGGGAGSGTGSDLPRLRQFIEVSTDVEFWNMGPNNSVASKGFGLVNAGVEYVFYVETGGTFSVQLPSGTYYCEWFSPRQSDGTAGPIAIGTRSGGTQYFTTPEPESDDWVLHISTGDSAQHIGNTIPSVMDPGQQVSVSITMKNTGTTTWTEDAGYQLGAVGDSDPFAGHRQYLAAGESIAPGQQKTFTFTMTAPSTPDVYTTDWRMLRENITWFGETLTKQVQVVGPPPIPGDFDSDGDVDQEDFGVFQACLSGSAHPYEAGCEEADLDSDGDVDENDFNVFQNCMGGANQPPGC